MPPIPNPNTPLFTLGLIGGIGSGKSTVARLFAQLGAGVIDADRIGHRVLLTPPIKDAVRTRWGNTVFDASGEVDRRAVAEIVFAQTESGRRELDFLKSLTHPLIRREIENEINAFEKSGISVAVLDAALLLESDWQTAVDGIVFVDAPKNIRLERVLQRGWTEKQFDSREKAQLPLDVKKAAANWTVDNSGNLETTLDQTRFLWQNVNSRTKLG